MGVVRDTATGDERDAGSALAAARVVGVLRAPSASRALALAEPAIAAGLTAVEVTFTIPEAGSVVAELAKRHPDVLVGAGTVLSGEQAATAIMAGADFIVGPHYEVEVQRVAERHHILYVPGALTPGEVHAAATATGGMVKVFPVARMGASAYVRDLLGPYPDLELMVTGGVSLGTAPEYLAAGARVVGIGSLFDLEPAELERALSAF